MKIKRKGRTYDDSPTVQVLDGEGQRDNYSINKVTLNVARYDGTVEYLGARQFHNSRKILDALAALGENERVVGVFVDDLVAPYRSVAALDLFLQAGHGLKYFRRGKVTWHSRQDLCQLLLQVGFPPDYVARIPPVQIQDRSSNPRRNRKDSRLS